MTSGSLEVKYSTLFIIIIIILFLSLPTFDEVLLKACIQRNDNNVLERGLRVIKCMM